MIYSTLLATLLAAAAVKGGAASPADEFNSVLLSRQQNSAKCLNTNLIQSASDKTGQEPGTEGIKAGQAESAV